MFIQNSLTIWELYNLTSIFLVYRLHIYTASKFLCSQLSKFIWYIINLYMYVDNVLYHPLECYSEGLK